MSGKRPSLQWYPGDWLRDPGVRSVSLAARGLWTDMLCLMFESDHKGYLSLSGKAVTAEQLARMTGGSTDEVSRLLAELESAGVFSRTDDGVIYSRRMARDEYLHDVRSKAGKLGAPFGRRGGRPRKTAKTAKEGQTQEPAEGQEKGQKGQNNPTTPPIIPFDCKRQTNPPSSSSSSSPGEESPGNPSCPETHGPPAPAPLLIFPTDGKEKEWSLMEEKVAELRAAFPSLDVLAECRRALAWVQQHPARRKTADGMGRFLFGWLSRSQNRGHGHGHANGRTPQPAGLNKTTAQIDAEQEARRREDAEATARRCQTDRLSPEQRQQLDRLKGGNGRGGAS